MLIFAWHRHTHNSKDIFVILIFRDLGGGASSTGCFSPQRGSKGEGGVASIKTKKLGFEQMTIFPPTSCALKHFRKKLLRRPAKM